MYVYTMYMVYWYTNVIVRLWYWQFLVSVDYDIGSFWYQSYDIVIVSSGSFWSNSLLVLDLELVVQCIGNLQSQCLQSSILYANLFGSLYR